MQLSRRSLIVLGSAAAAVAALPLLLRSRRPHPRGLVPDPEKRLDLPQGFHYEILDRAGDTMSDGYRVPSLPDGMGCFPGPSGTLVLVRNHEVTARFGRGAYDPGNVPAEAYDPEAFGGVTRLVVNEKTASRVSSNLVLTGTLKTCAGGRSPWGWLACEETTDGKHGYVFVCRPDAQRVAPPQRIVGFGRFAHEAAGVDPETLITYMTEDRVDGCLYRFVPKARATPFEGQLQALAIVGRDGLELALDAKEGEKLDVRWVDVVDPDPSDDTVRTQARERGAAVFRRGEGLFFAEGSVYFVTTFGGPKDRGQVFRLVIGKSPEPDRLELLAQVRDTSVLEFPDNVTVAPWGDVIMAEDGPDGNFVRGLTPDGFIYDICYNAASDGELSGLCFAPDGQTLFLSLFLEGLTMAVRGPFAALGRAKR